ncbi:hypothetical protein ACAF60_07885 [Klebsiella aerogenes]|uniref:hypothetical protein n=1 Tax=Klebsiella aerogenes TaxID=548 RepID=UPI000A38A9AF|nr:hypothetical protein [Klebsiella aerogenes]EKT8945013.1 hypothetical protein [Klebsiella aerogenes]EKV8595957.1 hypothetical protein [Klebsiella aerogenes]OUE90457.1 hypothetical protein AZZ82_000543 [Klebsiella aerogenes]
MDYYNINIVNNLINEATVAYNTTMDIIKERSKEDTLEGDEEEWERLFLLIRDIEDTLYELEQFRFSLSSSVKH